MENKIEVGEYVRTRGGHIHKVTKIDNNKLVYWGKISCGWSLEQLQDIIKSHSKNIIDLIEVGDYINGEKIVEIETDPFVKGQINLWTDIQLVDVYGDYKRLKYIFNDIKSIVTKEMFASAEYRVETD